MKIDLFDFELPEELIAQRPSDRRDHSRLLVIDKDNKKYEDKMFYDIVDYFHDGDVLVRNNTKVIPARLLGIKEKTGAHCELLLLRQLEGDNWECLTRPAKSLKVGLVKHSQLSPSNCLNKRSSQCAPVFSFIPKSLAGITFVLFLTKTSPS